MADVVSPEVRSRMMASIRGKNTRPEVILRSGLHQAGFRYNLNDRRLPGKPDLVFPRYRAVVFAHGCFWHGHDCHLFRWPATRPEFWKAKIASNVARDERSSATLLAACWRVGVVWECALKGKGKVDTREVVSACGNWICGEEQQFSLRGG